MPYAGPVVKKGVFNRREKITINGLTATRAHHQTLRRQQMNKKFRDIARAKRQAAEIKAAENASSKGNDSQHPLSTCNSDDPARRNTAGIFYEYTRGSMVALENSGAQAASASAAAEIVLGARSKTETVEMAREVKDTDSRDMASVINGGKRQSGAHREDEI